MLERDLPNEQSVDDKELSEAQKCYNYAQVFLIKYMLDQRVITSAEEYTEKYAEIFHMLATGAIQTRRKVDWHRIRKKMDSIRDATAEKVKSFKLFDNEGEGNGEGGST